MDVSATGAAAAAASAQGAITGSVEGVVAHDAPAPVTTLPAADTQTPTTSHGNDNHSAIAPAVAKLFNVPLPAAPVSLDVSYRVVNDTHQIITVFTDPKTGQEVAQFPPESLADLAQFFDQQQGATFDRSA